MGNPRYMYKNALEMGNSLYRAPLGKREEGSLKGDFERH
jgi:hypothetical protein